MGAFLRGTHSATVALAAMFACSVAVIPVAQAQSPAAAEPTRGEMPSEPAARTAAIETGADAKPAEPAKDAAASPAEPTAGGAPPVSDFKEPEPAKDEPAAVAATPAPTDPSSTAVLARLSGSAPLLQRVPAKQREAMQAFYALGNYKPVWIVDGSFTPAANSVVERLRAAGEDGLDPAAYPIPGIGTAGKSASEAEIAEAIAEADVMLSAAALLYARDARGGRINLANLSKLVTPALDLPSADVLLPDVIGAGDQAGAKLQAYNPRTAGYLALKRRLAAMRGPAPQATPSLNLSVGPVLKVGMRDPRVLKLRDFFGLPSRTPGTLDAAPGESDAYDKDVSDAVAKFQRSRDLPDNGNLTRSTIVALATRRQPTQSGGGGNEAELLVNMERWRWLPGDLGSDYVLVNVPEYRLRVYRGGTVRDETRVIVGKTETPTPLFSGMIEYAVVNPSWFVPPSILKQMLASGRTSGFEVVRHGGQISLRQPPGERNALGFIKFLFPNQHAVYLHDTPNRSLFSASRRAMSHGCVRVDDPFRFGDAVLPEEWTSERLKKLIGKGERTIRLPEKLPVHLAYFTAYVDDSGIYRTLPDVYGYDAKMKAALGLSTDPVAVANRPTEPGRIAAPIVRTPAQANGQGSVHQQAARRTATAPAPYPQTQTAQRVRRPADVYGEPGLWTPEQPARAQPRSYW